MKHWTFFIATSGRALTLAVALLLTACSSARPWVNAPRPSPLPIEAVSQPREAKPVVVAVALSGGGARAAAFGLGVLKGMKAADFTVDGRPTTLLDEVVQISGVSGGSILAAHYAAFGDATLERFEPDFLLYPFEARLLQELLWPQRLYQLSSPWYGRSHLLAERLDTLYRGMTFADVRRRPGAPELIITATDLTTGAPFDFTDEKFELICSDVNATPLSFAVAASSAVPLLLSPLTLQNHAGHCPGRASPLPVAADTSYRTQLLRQSIDSYRNATERPFIHLVDGGVTDNLGVRLTLDRMMAGGSMTASFAEAAPGTLHQLVLVTVNAERGLAERIDSSDRVPGTAQVLESLIFGAGSRESQVTLGILSDDLKRWRAELVSTRGQPGSPFAADAELHVINLSLHDERDDRLRDRLLRVPTAFSVEAQDVRDLQKAGARALQEAPEFRALMQSLRSMGTSH